MRFFCPLRSWAAPAQTVNLLTVFYQKSCAPVKAAQLWKGRLRLPFLLLYARRQRGALQAPALPLCLPRRKRRRQGEPQTGTACPQGRPAFRPREVKTSVRCARHAAEGLGPARRVSGRHRRPFPIGELGDGCLQTQIADEYCVSRQTINTSVKRLVQQGFLSLAPGRGRGMHLHLTPAGRAVMEQKLAPVFALEESVLASMPAAQRAQLLRLLGRYVQLYRRHVRAPG